MPAVAAPRVLLVSLGWRDEFGHPAYRQALAGAAGALADGRGRDAAVTLGETEVPGRSLAWRLQQATRLLADGIYRFNAPRASGNGEHERGPRSVALLISGEVTPDLETARRRGEAIAEGMKLARDLGNLPGNICNPAYLAETARVLGKEFAFEVDVLERDRHGEARHGRGPVRGARLEPSVQVHRDALRAQQARREPIVLVGKGVTFDSGGISLKPGANMDEMKFDMCGAASVFGAIKTVARLELPINLVGIVPAAENMPGGNASRPGDVVTSMSGQTIEILNTDAEGRLGLCDALTYAERFDPACVIDVATLTGACAIALGNVASGLMANDDALAAELLACGTETGDRAWQLAVVGRLSESAQEQLRRHEQPRWAPGGHHYCGVLPRALRQKLQVGAPRHRRHQRLVRRRQGRDRTAGAAAGGVPDADALPTGRLEGELAADLMTERQGGPPAHISERISQRGRRFFALLRSAWVDTSATTHATSPWRWSITRSSPWCRCSCC